MTGNLSKFNNLLIWSEMNTICSNEINFVSFK